MPSTFASLREYLLRTAIARRSGGTRYHQGAAAIATAPAQTSRQASTAIVTHAGAGAYGRHGRTRDAG
jgi:hypothetical protein